MEYSFRSLYRGMLCKGKYQSWLAVLKAMGGLSPPLIFCSVYTQSSPSFLQPLSHFTAIICTDGLPFRLWKDTINSLQIVGKDLKMSGFTGTYWQNDTTSTIKIKNKCPDTFLLSINRLIGDSGNVLVNSASLQKTHISLQHMAFPAGQLSTKLEWLRQHRSDISITDFWERDGCAVKSSLMTPVPMNRTFLKTW